MRGYSLPVQSIITLLKSFESFNATSNTVKLPPMPASSTGVGDVPLMTRPEVITCHSTNVAVNQAQHWALRRGQTPPPTEGESDVSGTSSEDTEEQDDMDVSEAMSDSALIAFSYRLHNSEDTMTSQSQSSSSSQAPMTLDSASCLPASRTLSELEETAESGSFHNQVAHLKRSKGSPKLNSMKLCNATPIIIELTQEQDDGYGVLQDYRRVSQNIILDSLRPDLAPHIVITPADDEGNLYEIYQNNRAGPQYFPYLPVPPFFGLTCRMHTYEEYMGSFYPLTYSQEPELSRAYYRKVSCFQSVSQIRDWQSFIHDMAHILSIKLHKQVAIEASLKAPAFRVRYDVSEFIEHIGWQDPANVFFTHRQKFCTRDSVVIRSDSPRVAPHIIIDFAPPNYVASSSVYPGPSYTQDQAFLLAPLPYERMNTASTNVMDVDLHSLVDTSSDASSIGPHTPTELQRVGSGFFAGLTEHDEEDITSAYGGYKEYKVTTEDVSCNLLEDRKHSGTSDIQEEISAFSPKFFISSNDEEDDDWDADSLPDIETDPWFIEARARSATATLLMSC